MKIYIYAALAVLIISTITFASHKIYHAGYDKRDSEVQAEIIAAQEKARKEEEERWRETVAAAEAQIVIEERIVEKIREVEIEIPKVVEKIVTVSPECANLGTDYARLLNDQVRAANRVPSPEVTD